MLGANGDFASLNLFAYCGNNPISRKDIGGYFWDTVFDAVSLAFSIAEVAACPTNVWLWVGLAGDIVDLIPGVTGVGEAMDAVGVWVKVSKATEFTDEALDVIRTLDKVGEATKSTAEAGKKIHKGYKTGYELVEDMTKEAIKGNNRMDFLDEANKFIYELKPFNAKGIRDGINQLTRYNKSLGGGYTLCLEFY